MHNCMTGCIVKCSNVVHGEDGNYLASALEFETLALLGSNCAVGKWEDVAELDRLCDEIGIDTVEAGAAIAVLMDSGQMEWGNVEGMKKLLEEMWARALTSGRRSATAPRASARSSTTRVCRWWKGRPCRPGTRGH